MVRDMNEKISKEEENINCVLCASKFLPSGPKVKIASSSNNYSFQNEVSSLVEGRV